MKQYTISIFTKDTIGLLNRVTIVFTRCHLNIESITASESEVKGIHRYTIVLNARRDEVDKIAGKIEKLVEVLKAFVHEEEEVVHQEIALYKMSTKALINVDIEKIIRQNNARILTLTAEYLVIEKTGHKKETQRLFEELEKGGVLEFARSGRVAVTKPMKELAYYLHELEEI